MGKKKHSKEFKARIALDAIKGQKTISELAAETYELSTNFHYLIREEEWNLEEFIRSGNDHFKNNYFGFKII